jgi:hypothetical protein
LADDEKSYATGYWSLLRVLVVSGVFCWILAGSCGFWWILAGSGGF